MDYDKILNVFINSKASVAFTMTLLVVGAAFSGIQCQYECHGLPLLVMVGQHISVVSFSDLGCFISSTRICNNSLSHFWILALIAF